MADSSQRLQRRVRFPFLVFYGVGTMVGGGFYALSGEVAGRVGLHAPLAFALAGALALLSALSFAELSGRLPHSGGSARYVEEAFGSARLAALVGWLVISTGVVSAATLAVATTGFLRDLAPLPSAPTTLVLVLAMGAIAAWGIAEAVAIVVVITLLEVGALLYIVLSMGEVLGTLPAQASAILVPADLSVVAGILGASFLAFYAFIGFEDMVTVAEEVQDVRRALPAAVITSLGLTMALYVVVATVAVLAVPPAELAAADTPLARVVAEQGQLAITAIVLVSMLTGINGALVQVVMAARVAYGMAERRVAPRWLATVNPHTRTPLPATTLATLLVLALALTFGLEALAKATSAIILVVFTLVNLGLLRIKRRQPDTPAAVPRLPLWVPVGGALASAALLLFQISRWLTAAAA
ncbi:APC family permease [Halochromatium sp.]